MLFSVLFTPFDGFLKTCMTLVWTSYEYVEVHILNYLIHISICNNLIHIAN